MYLTAQNNVSDHVKVEVIFAFFYNTPRGRVLYVFYETKNDCWFDTKSNAFDTKITIFTVY